MREIKFRAKGQYTGIKDVNGKKILEGDVIRYNYEDFINNEIVFLYAKVIFCEGTFILDNSKEIEYLGECEIEEMGIKVIGNIYDNPELLGEE